MYEIHGGLQSAGPEGALRCKAREERQHCGASHVRDTPCTWTVQCNQSLQVGWTRAKGVFSELVAPNQGPLGASVHAFRRYPIRAFGKTCQCGTDIRRYPVCGTAVLPAYHVPYQSLGGASRGQAPLAGTWRTRQVA